MIFQATKMTSKLKALSTGELTLCLLFLQDLYLPLSLDDSDSLGDSMWKMIGYIKKNLSSLWNTFVQVTNKAIGA